MTRATSAEKPGYVTTEFWMSVLTIIAATVLRLTHDIDADAWMVVVGGSAVGYNFSRGIAKK